MKTRTGKNPIDSKHFSKSKDVWVAEASDIEYETRIQPIYISDTSKRGIPIKSEKTGRIVWFYLWRTERDREGDITLWHYKAIQEHTPGNPKLQKLIVTIIND